MRSDRISDDVSVAARTLKNGGVIAMPTETVYGLAACALDEAAVRRVFTIKGRPSSHPLIVHLSPDSDFSLWGVLTPSARTLAKTFWPGPLTLLVQRTRLVPDWVTGGRDTVAIRVPAHPIAARLLQEVGTGVVAPSANKFGKVSPTSAQHVMADLGDDVDLILDGGSCDVGVESTIVECIGDAVTVLRPGAITLEQIENAVRKTVAIGSGESRAPGMLASHYAPAATLVLCENLDDAMQTRSKLESSGARVSLIHHDDPHDYARLLYEELRAADSRGDDTIVAVLPPATGLGVAIRDRLTKAATR